MLDILSNRGKLVPQDCSGRLHVSSDAIVAVLWFGPSFPPSETDKVSVQVSFTIQPNFHPQLRLV